MKILDKDRHNGNKYNNQTATQPTDTGTDKDKDKEKEKMTTIGDTFCDTCKERVEAPSLVKYKGQDFHKSCFLKETEIPDLGRNPQIKMVLPPRDIESLLRAMEAYLENGDSAEPTAEPTAEPKAKPIHYNAVKRLYPNIALRLAQASKSFAICTHCGRA